MNYFTREKEAHQLPRDIDNFQHSLSWAFTASIEGLRAISANHPGAYRKIDDEGSLLFRALAKPPKDCKSPAHSVASITTNCLREILDELVQDEDPRRALYALEALGEEGLGFLIAVVVQVLRLSSSPSHSVSKRSRELVEALGAEGCASWLDVATAAKFPGIARQLGDNDRNVKEAVFPE